MFLKRKDQVVPTTLAQITRSQVLKFKCLVDVDICDVRSSRRHTIATSKCHKITLRPSQSLLIVAICDYRNIAHLLFLPSQVPLFATCDHRAIARSQYRTFKCSATCLITNFRCDVIPSQIVNVNFAFDHAIAYHTSQMADYDVGLGSRIEVRVKKKFIEI